MNISVLIKLCCISVIHSYILSILFMNFICKLLILYKRKLNRYENRILFNKEVSRGPVPDPKTRGLEVRYRTPSQSYEDCLRVR